MHFTVVRGVALPMLLSPCNIYNNPSDRQSAELTDQALGPNEGAAQVSIHITPTSIAKIPV